GSKKAVTKTGRKGGKKAKVQEGELRHSCVQSPEAGPPTPASLQGHGNHEPASVNDIFERIAGVVSPGPLQQEVHHHSSEIQTAVRLLLPGELAKHAVSEGTKAVN
ncbi:hypothetical protein DPEC_G00373450, partial [Dallia pectoralis]